MNTLEPSGRLVVAFQLSLKSKQKPMARHPSITIASLPEELRAAENVDMFKSKLNLYIFSLALNVALFIHLFIYLSMYLCI